VVSRPWLEPVRFDYRVGADDAAVVRLLADLDTALGPPRGPSLLVRRATARSNYPALAVETSPGERLLWQVSFEVPVAVVECPHALFGVEAPRRITIALPAPGHRAETPGLSVRGQGRPFRSLIRRGAATFVAGVALAESCRSSAQRTLGE
jgi:hypothetical protein